MMLFLKIVAGFFVALVLVIVVIALLIRWKLRTLGSTLGRALEALAGAGAQAGIPPMRIEVERDESLEWVDEDAVQALGAPLLQEGFQKIGDFSVDMNVPVSMRAFSHPTHRAYAVIYEVAPVGVWMDLVTHYTDDRSCTFSTGKESGMDYPDGRQVKNYPDLGARELLTRFLAERPQGEMLPCPPTEFATRFEQEHAREMDWRAARGGPTAKEIRRSMEVWGDSGEVDASVVEMIQEQWQAHFNEFWQEELRANYLAEGGLDAAEWEAVRDRLVFVHDRLTATQTAELFEPAVYELHSSTEEDDEDDEDAVERRMNALREQAKHGHARTTFAQMNDEFPEELRYQRHGEVQAPLLADVWLRPKQLA